MQIIAGAGALWMIAAMGQAIWFEPLRQLEDEGMNCSEAGDWCLAIDAEAGPVLVREGARYPIWSLPEAPEGDLEVWPQVIRLPEGRVILGVTEHRSTGYSGGGAARAELHLFSVTPGEVPQSRPALSLVMTGNIMIRACFSEEEAVRRRDFCKDLYDYRAALVPLGDAQSTAPDFRLEVTATRQPAEASRYLDSSARPPLTEAELAGGVDAECSFRRVFRWDEATLTYRPDTPLPDCSEFTDF